VTKRRKDTRVERIGFVYGVIWLLLFDFFNHQKAKPWIFTAEKFVQVANGVMTRT